VYDISIRGERVIYATVELLTRSARANSFNRQNERLISLLDESTVDLSIDLSLVSVAVKRWLHDSRSNIPKRDRSRQEAGLRFLADNITKWFNYVTLFLIRDGLKIARIKLTHLRVTSMGRTSYSNREISHRINSSIIARSAWNERTNTNEKCVRVVVVMERIILWLQM